MMTTQKHEQLVLKCYPRLPKNSTADVQPNSSELSYLCYYASSRSSKLPKVGAFLERKTTKDVHKAQSANVLITLQILTALLSIKSLEAPGGFPLIAPYVLRIIIGILDNTTDISLIEASGTTWSAFCAQDQAILAADSFYRSLYEQVVKHYAHFAQKGGLKKLGTSTVAVAPYDAIRLREAGLRAIESVLASDAPAFEGAKPLITLTIPAILSNLGDFNQLLRAHRRAIERRTEQEEGQGITTVRTRTSIAQDRPAEVDPREAVGTAQHADHVAEERVGVVAIDCLNAAFATNNRGQVRNATTSVLDYMSGLRDDQDDWMLAIMSQCTVSTPVQSRFVLLVTAVDTLVRLPLEGANLRQHLLYTSLINHTLRSDINLIGLSVMDVLLSLIAHLLRVLQLQDPPLTLINALKSCIAGLATHIYYTDQVTDMLSAILQRVNNGYFDKARPVADDLVQEILKVANTNRPESATGSFALAVAAAADRPMVANPSVVNPSPHSILATPSRGSSSEPVKVLPRVGDLKRVLLGGRAF